MKKLLLLFIALAILGASVAEAQTVGRTNVPPSVTLSWTAVPTNGIAGYNVYFGGASGIYTNQVQILGATNTSCVLTNVTSGGVYYCVVTIFTSGSPALESNYSSEVSATVPATPAAPAGLKVVNTQ